MDLRSIVWGVRKHRPISPDENVVAKRNVLKIGGVVNDASERGFGVGYALNVQQIDLQITGVREMECLVSPSGFLLPSR